MANVDRPMGFVWARADDGSGKPAERKLAAADRSALTTNNHGDLYVGDAISLSSGAAVPFISGQDPYGVVVSVGQNGTMGNERNGEFIPSDLTKRYLGHADSGYVNIIPVRGQYFRCQSASDLDLTVGSPADVNVSANTVAHGSRVTGMSSMELTTDSNSDVVVVEVLDEPENDGTLTNTAYVVEFVTAVVT